MKNKMKLQLPGFVAEKSCYSHVNFNANNTGEYQIVHANIEPQSTKCLLLTAAMAELTGGWGGLAFGAWCESLEEYGKPRTGYL